MSLPAVVVDTNVFVAAGFNRASASARVLEQIRSGRLRMVWNEATREEVRRILSRIPPLSWRAAEPLFAAANQFTGETFPDRFRSVPDPDDRKFAALAVAAGATLITSDDHLLARRSKIGVSIVTPGEFAALAER